MGKQIKVDSKQIAIAIVLVLCVAGLAYSYMPREENHSTESHGEHTVLRQYAYGFDLDSFDVDRFEMKPNEFLGDILAARGIPYESIDALARAAEDTFSVRRLRPGLPCALVRKKGTGYVDAFVYEPNPYESVRFHIEPEIRVDIHRKPVNSCIETATGVINSSLWETMDAEGYPIGLIARMEDALAWSVSFQYVKKGDAFKLIYEQNYIEGNPVGVGKLIGASFYTGGKEINSIYFESDSYSGYFDEKGRPMKRAFLKDPVRYSRISSRYSGRRFHPILKRYKGHFGTDYAAPHGTPIMAVADGSVTKAGYTAGNGNYVKIRHDRTYETQYLHMSRFARGIKPGVRVKQGDVIGYVGQTGLATGPHVCFRFWKNGRQIDHLRENLPPPEPMPEENMPEYEIVRDEILSQLKLLQVDVFDNPTS